jgi:hypothetical protein
MRTRMEFNAQMSEVAPRAEPVDRGGRHPETVRHLANQEQPLALPSEGTSFRVSGRPFVAPLLQGALAAPWGRSAPSTKGSQHHAYLNRSGRPDLNRRHPAPKSLKNPSQRFAGIHNPSESFMTAKANLCNRHSR